jgi:hypothetical protein
VRNHAGSTKILDNRWADPAKDFTPAHSYGNLPSHSAPSKTQTTQTRASMIQKVSNANRPQRIQQLRQRHRRRQRHHHPTHPAHADGYYRIDTRRYQRCHPPSRHRLHPRRHRQTTPTPTDADSDQRRLRQRLRQNRRATLFSNANPPPQPYDYDKTPDDVVTILSRRAPSIVAHGIFDQHRRRRRLQPTPTPTNEGSDKGSDKIAGLPCLPTLFRPHNPTTTTKRPTML